MTGALSLPNSAGTGQYYISGSACLPGEPAPRGAHGFCLRGAVVALIALRRLRTDYLAMVLISLSLVLYDVCNNYVPLFNGADGLYNVPEPFAGAFHLTTNSFIPFFAALTGLIALLMWFVMSRITRAPMGRTFRAIRDDEVVAAALGKDVFRQQLKSMLIGSFYAGIGGGLIIQFGGSFNPTAWLPGETFVVFAVILVGGVGNNIGLLVGSLLVETLLVHLPAFLPAIPGHPGLIEYLDAVVIGVLLMVMLWFRPQGVVPERARRCNERRACAGSRWEARGVLTAGGLTGGRSSGGTRGRRHHDGGPLRGPRQPARHALRGYHESVPGCARRERRRLRGP